MGFKASVITVLASAFPIEDCSYVITRGIRVYNNVVQDIKIGVTTKHDILRIVGPPIIQTINNEWIYYSVKKSGLKINAHSPQKAVLIFNDKNILIKIMLYRGKELKKIKTTSKQILPIDQNILQN